MNRAVLVVDDEPDLAETCERLLTLAGWKVTTAISRAGALAALAAGPPPALALVDRHLSDGDGLDVLRAARALGTPVIVMSGRTSEENRRRTLAEGAVRFLTKPFIARELLDLARAIAGDPRGP